MTDLPAHIEVELNRLGVMPPAKPVEPPKEYPAVWRPSYVGEEPPF